jgi:hypothetical protein
MGALGRASCGVRREAPPRAERAMRQTRALRRRSHCMPFMLWSRCVGGHPFGESSRWPWPVRSRQFWMGFPMWRVPMRRFVAGSQCGGLWRVPMRRFVAGSQCGGLWRVPNAAVCGGFQCGGLWRVPMRRFVAGSNAAVCGGFQCGGLWRVPPRAALRGERRGKLYPGLTYRRPFGPPDVVLNKRRQSGFLPSRFLLQS